MEREGKRFKENQDGNGTHLEVLSTNLNEFSSTQNNVLTPLLTQNKFILAPEWKKALEKEFEKPYYKKLMLFLEKQNSLNKTIYPEGKDVFSWSQYCPSPEQVKVVILGQDPYHNVGQAHGLCFSVKHGIPPPPSLVNIYKELKNDIDGFQIPSHGCLIGWAKQGVLLLNAVLTVGNVSFIVEAHKANSHKAQGWEKFTDAIIQLINTKCENVVFILWGNYAIKKGSNISKSRHLILQGPHPSPLSAHRGFFGCRHFSTANQYLEKQGKGTIDWNDL